MKSDLKAIGVGLWAVVMVLGTFWGVGMVLHVSPTAWALACQDSAGCIAMHGLAWFGWPLLVGLAALILLAFAATVLFFVLGLIGLLGEWILKKADA